MLLPFRCGGPEANYATSKDAWESPDILKRLAVNKKLAEHEIWCNQNPSPSRMTSLYPGCLQPLDPIGDSRFMNKRILFLAFLGLLLIAPIACGLFGGDDETSEQSATSNEDSTSSATQESESVAVPSPTRVATEGDLFLQLVEPSETEVFTDAESLTVIGRTRVDALVTVNDTIVDPDIEGEFALDVPLEEGPNIIEIVTSVADGTAMDIVLVAIYVP